MKYYYSNEQDEVVSRDLIRSEFDAFRAEGQYLDKSFSDYLEECMYWNNGDLTPLDEHISNRKRRLRDILRYAHTDTANREDYDDEIQELTEEVGRLMAYGRC